MPNSFSEHFQLSITKALGDQLAEALAKLKPAPLTRENLDMLQKAPGVYQLYLKGQFVYVGKAEGTLPDRLGDHLKKITGRTLPNEDMTFTCMYVEEDLSAVAPERLLIKRHKAIGQIPWNNSGFGRHDPGRNRDKTIPDANDFDTLYPIDLGIEVGGLTVGKQAVKTFANAVKKGLPYLFRLQDSIELNQVAVNAPTATMTADEAFRLIASHAPPKWQVCALTGYVIMYKTDRELYPSARRYYRKSTVEDAAPISK